MEKSKIFLAILLSIHRCNSVPSSAPTVQPSAVCPGGYTLLYGGCYQHVSTNRNWTEARADCRQRANGWLAALDSAPKQAVPSGLSISGNVWIGLHKTIPCKQGGCVMNSNMFWDAFPGDVVSTSTYQNFGPGQPNTEADLCMTFDMDNNKWYDEACCSSRPYICQTALGNTYAPSATPTCAPPTALPTNCPSSLPSTAPTSKPSTAPSSQLSGNPSGEPSTAPSSLPTNAPSQQFFPPEFPMPTSCLPTSAPSDRPSGIPTAVPSGSPTGRPSVEPSGEPSAEPTSVPSGVPSESPSSAPSSDPSGQPSGAPSRDPSAAPSAIPSSCPSGSPSSSPSLPPTGEPSGVPSGIRTAVPSESSTGQSSIPTVHPTSSPLHRPSLAPSIALTEIPTNLATRLPTAPLTAEPSTTPSTLVPTIQPSKVPSTRPSARPTVSPTRHPTASPTSAPTALVTRTVIALTGQMSFQGFSCGDFSNQSLGMNDAFIVAFSSSMDDTVSTEEISIDGCVEVTLNETERKLLLSPAATSNLLWSADYTVPEGEDPSDIFNSFKSMLANVSSSGELQTNFVSKLSGDTSSISLISSSTDNSFRVIVVSNPPTASPTDMGSSGTDSSGIGEVSGLDLVILVPLTVVCCAVILFVACFLWQRRLVQKKEAADNDLKKHTSPPLGALKEFGQNYASMRKQRSKLGINGEIKLTPEKGNDTYTKDSALLSHWLSMSSPDFRSLESPPFPAGVNNLFGDDRGSTASPSGGSSRSTSTAGGTDFVLDISDQEHLNAVCRDALGYPPRVEVPFINYLLNMLKVNQLSKAQLQHLKFYFDSLVRENKNFVDALDNNACSPVKLNFGDFSPVGPARTAKEDTFEFIGYDDKYDLLLDSSKLNDYNDIELGQSRATASATKKAKSKRRVTFDLSPLSSPEHESSFTFRDENNDIVEDLSLNDGHIDVLTPVKSTLTENQLPFKNPFVSETKTEQSSFFAVAGAHPEKRDIFDRSNIGNTPRIEGASPYVPGSDGSQTLTPSNASGSSTPTMTESPPLVNLNYLSRHAAARNLNSQFRELHKCSPSKASPLVQFGSSVEICTPQTITSETDDASGMSPIEAISPIVDNGSALRESWVPPMPPPFVFKSRMQSKSSLDDSKPSSRPSSIRSTSSRPGSVRSTHGSGNLTPLAAAAVAASRVVSKGVGPQAGAASDVGMSLAASWGSRESPEEKWTKWTRTQSQSSASLSSSSEISTLSSEGQKSVSSSGTPSSAGPFSGSSGAIFRRDGSAHDIQSEGIEDCF